MSETHEEVRAKGEGEEPGSAKSASFGKLPANVVWLSVASLFNDIGSEIVARGLPLFLATTLGVSKTLVGLVEGLADATSALMNIISGWYSDRWGSRKVVAGTGYTLTALARPLLIFATSWLLPLISRFIDRFGAGVRSSPRDALIADSVSPEMRGRAFGFHEAMDPFGAVLGALLGALLLYVWQGTRITNITPPEWMRLAIIASIPPIIAATIVFAFVREERRERREPPPLRQLLHIGRDDRIKKFILVVTLFTLGQSSDAFLILRAQSVGMHLWTIFLVIAFFNLVTTLASYPAGILSDRWTRKAVMRLGWLTYTVIYAGFAFATEVWQIIVLFLAYGLYYGLTGGVAKAFVADLVPKEERAAAFGVYNGAVGIAVLPASLIAGGLWEAYGVAAPFLFGATMSLIAVALLGMVGEGDVMGSRRIGGS